MPTGAIPYCVPSPGNQALSPRTRQPVAPTPEAHLASNASIMATLTCYAFRCAEIKTYKQVQLSGSCGDIYTLLAFVTETTVCHINTIVRQLCA
jgi:hypothetical protein